jgi:DNA-directed RNA polymerase subunit M
MEFCPTCGTKLVLSPGEEGVALWLSCPQCNYKKHLTESKSPIPKNQLDLPKGGIITVVDEKEDLSNLPTIRFNCPKCDNALAFQWRAQTQWTDESATQFYRCTRCGYTSRG